MKGLYIVTPDWDDSDTLLVVTELALQSGAALVQYRHKTANAVLRRQQAQALLVLCRRYQRPLIINDDVALCLELGADGVHVGSTDASVAQVRAAIGPHKIVGASCYGSLALAHDAYRAGASYIAFGGFYPSCVKKYPVTTPTDIVTLAKTEIGLPSVVIGGMTPENAAPLIAAGADMVAVISSVYLAAEPAIAARDFVAFFEK